MLLAKGRRERGDGSASELGPGSREDRGGETGRPVSERPHKELPTAKPGGSGRRLSAEVGEAGRVAKVSPVPAVGRSR